MRRQRKPLRFAFLRFIHRREPIHQINVFPTQLKDFTLPQSRQQCKLDNRPVVPRNRLLQPQLLDVTQCVDALIIIARLLYEASRVLIDQPEVECVVEKRLQERE